MKKLILALATALPVTLGAATVATPASAGGFFYFGPTWGAPSPFHYGARPAYPYWGQSCRIENVRVKVRTSKGWRYIWQPRRVCYDRW